MNDQSKNPPHISVVNMTKRFGSLIALDSVSLEFAPGSFHALLGENGAGKSTLVKCMMGYYQADQGDTIIDGASQQIANPKRAHQLGLGMVYQHFTLVPSMTVAENLVLGEEDLPTVISWKDRIKVLEDFMQSMPFQLDLERPISGLAAGEKQKLEILKQLHLGSRFLILDEPTSVLTPDEADQILGLMRNLTNEMRISAILITHKLREVEAYAHEVSVLRQGSLVGQGLVKDLNHTDLVAMMIGRDTVSEPANRITYENSRTALEIRSLTVGNDKGLKAVDNVSLSVSAGEIVGIAGISGNGQTEFVEVLAGQRTEVSGEIIVKGMLYDHSRSLMRELGIHLLPEEPLRNSCVRNMSVAENLAIRNFDLPQNTRAKWFINSSAIFSQGRRLIEQFQIKTQGPDALIETLSGGNVQRTVLARELSTKVELLIVQNPCFGLDLKAVSEIRNRILYARNSGTAILLISEDLDEILELSDRIVVMFEGRFVFETPRAAADVQVIGRHMASHA